ncbi:unnamed protein product [Orchesella dallaii]|uniref:Gustatory receptor n=1 Tax=Orchesella dallaii TaxID=48710 RepID=A0ABP1RQH7_9HEXA
MLNSQNLHTKFLAGYLTWSKYLGGTLFYYDKLSKKLHLLPWKWYRWQFKFRLKIAWILTILSVLESFRFHHVKKSKSPSHSNTMVLQLFYLGCFTAFTYANHVHWKKQKEICNLYNAMVDFERRYGESRKSAGKGFLLYTIWVMCGVMVGRMLIIFTFPCVLDVVGSSLIEECRLNEHANDLSRLTISESLDLLKMAVITTNYTIFGGFYPGFIAELVCFLYIPCVFLNQQLVSAKSTGAQCFITIVAVGGTLGEIYVTSQKLLKAVKASVVLQKNVWFRKVFLSWPVQKVRFGQVNFLDRLSPITLVDFSICLTVNMILVGRT